MGRKTIAHFDEAVVTDLDRFALGHMQSHGYAAASDPPTKRKLERLVEMKLAQRFVRNDELRYEITRAGKAVL